MTLVPPNSRDNFGTYVTAGPAPSGDTTGVADTASIAAAISAAPSGGLLVLAQGDYYIDKTTIDKRMGIVGAGRELTKLHAVATATGPLINWNNSTLRPGATLRGLTVDMTSATGIAAVYMHNVRNGQVTDVYIDHGTVGLQLDLAQTMTVLGVDCFNQSTSGFLCSHASSSGNVFLSCLFDATTVSATAGYDITGGIDWWFIGCKSFRAPGIAQTLNYGWRMAYTNTNATNALVRCSVDGVSDLTSDSATVAGVYLQNIGNCVISNSHVSGYSSADATSNKAVKLDGCNSIRIQDNWLSGHGILFTGTASDSVKVTNNQFYSGDTNAARFNISTAPTNLDATGNTLGQGSSNIPITDSVSGYYGALTRNAQTAAGIRLERPSGATFETTSIEQLNTNNTSLTSGTLYLFAVWLPQGLTVTNINWAAGATALTNGGGSPHYWVALYDASKNLLRQSTDSTSATVSANAVKTTALSSTYTTTTEGMFYLGVMVNSGGGTQPTFANFAGLSAYQGTGVVRSATADTSLVGTAPNPAGATSNIGQMIYAYVS